MRSNWLHANPAPETEQASIKLKHIDLDQGRIVQDARQVDVFKFSKTLMTWFFSPLTTISSRSSPTGLIILRRALGVDDIALIVISEACGSGSKVLERCRSHPKGFQGCVYGCWAALLIHTVFENARSIR